LLPKRPNAFECKFSERLLAYSDVTRAAAARALADDPDPRTGRALAKAVSDKNWVVRAAALEAIAKRGDPALLHDIEPAMSDKKDIVRYSAAAAVLHLVRIAQGNAHTSQEASH
jgi:HEAT repeat protein